MLLKSEKGFSLVLLAVFVAVIGVAGVSYAVFQSNSNDADSLSNQGTGVEQSSNRDEEKVAVGTAITTGDSEFGTMLFNDKKQAIYIWELEETNKPECYGDCAEVWPPVLTDGAPRAMGSVRSDLLGTTKRTDGSTQLTYNGKPLYYYAHEGAGEVKCHNVSTHGGLWWVIRPNGVRAQ